MFNLHTSSMILYVSIFTQVFHPIFLPFQFRLESWLSRTRSNLPCLYSGMKKEVFFQHSLPLALAIIFFLINHSTTNYDCNSNPLRALSLSIVFHAMKNFQHYARQRPSCTLQTDQHFIDCKKNCMLLFFYLLCYCIYEKKIYLLLVP